jgi:4-oxalocrotonate tautomerase family enzyme
MPILQVHLLAGRPQSTKALLVKELTEAVERALGADSERVQVLITEYTEGAWNAGGRPLVPGGRTDS